MNQILTILKNHIHLNFVTQLKETHLIEIPKNNLSLTFNKVFHI